MSKNELTEILRLHKMWLSGEDGGLRAALRGADLHGEDLRGADLRGADLDYSSFPLWCGGAYFKADERLVQQVLAHLCTLEVESEEWAKLREVILPFAKKSHRADDLGL